MSRPAASVRDEIRQSRPFESTAAEAVVGLLLTADQLRRRLGELVEPHGITHQQYNVLRILRGSHPEPLQTLEIAGRMIEQTPGITRLLDRLEAKGLVERQRGSDDRRCVWCRITAAGRRLVAALDAPVAALARAGFAGLDERRQRQLVADLDQLRATLRDAPAPAENRRPGGRRTSGHEKRSSS